MAKFYVRQLALSLLVFTFLDGRQRPFCNMGHSKKRCWQGLHFKVDIGGSKVGFDQKFEVQQPVQQGLGDLGERLLFQPVEVAI